MTLEQLRIFVAVAEREHVTNAAQNLHLTQSAVSAAIAALESRHAVKLFDRVGRRIAITEAGRVFLVEARGVLARAAAAEQALADLAGLARGNLNIAASQTVGNYWLPPLMQRFRTANPGISLSLTIGNTLTVAQMVADRIVDIGFVEGDVEDPSLTVAPVAEDELVLVSAPADAPDGVRMSPARLKTLRWIMREEGSGTRAILGDVMASRGIPLSDLNVVLKLPSNEAVRAAVEAGTGAAVLSRMVVEQSLRSGTLVALEFMLPKRRFYGLRHKDRTLSRAEAAFGELIAAA